MYGYQSLLKIHIAQSKTSHRSVPLITSSPIYLHTNRSSAVVFLNIPRFARPIGVRRALQIPIPPTNKHDPSKTQHSTSMHKNPIDKYINIKIPGYEISNKCGLCESRIHNVPGFGCKHFKKNLVSCCFKIVGRCLV